MLNRQINNFSFYNLSKHQLNIFVCSDTLIKIGNRFFYLKTKHKLVSKLTQGNKWRSASTSFSSASTLSNCCGNKAFPDIYWTTVKVNCTETSWKEVRQMNPCQLLKQQNVSFCHLLESF